MKQHNEQSKIKCKEFTEDQKRHALDSIETQVPDVNDKISEKIIHVLIQEIDAVNHELLALEGKLGNNKDQIDIGARNCLAEGARIGTIK